MKTMDCRTAEEILARRYDDRGTDPPMEALREHLRVCPACAREAEEYRRAGDVLRRMTEARVRAKEASLDVLWTRVKAGIDERRAAEAPAGVPRLIRRWFWVPALAALAVLVLLFYPSDVSRTPFAPKSFDVSVEDIESDTATVALVDRGEDLPRVIWIIEDGKT